MQLLVCYSLIYEEGELGSFFVVFETELETSLYERLLNMVHDSL